MLLNTNNVLSLYLLCLSILVPTLAQPNGTAQATINPTATNVALATQAVAKITQSDSPGILNQFLNGIPGFIEHDDQAVKATVAQTVDQINKVVHPKRYYSYGRSPPVYPTPTGTGTGGWAEAYAKARAAVNRLSDAEKANITLGAVEVKGCGGFVGPLPSIGFDGLCLQDAESGVRGAALVNGYAAQLSVGASWNTSLAYERGFYIGREHRDKGVSVALGPVVGPLGRIAKGGRNWEGFSNDPYLAGALVGPTITAMQKSVIACVKHLLANKQETNRLPFFAGFIPQLGTQAVSSNVDDRTMHELYLWPFYDALKAEPGAIMCSYNMLNGSYGCQNSKIMNGFAKTELGFQGFIVSDWYAVHTGIAANNAGLDMVMPSSMQLTPESLARAVANGSVSSSRLDDQAIRILAAAYRYANLQEPGLNSRVAVDARDPGASSVLLQSAVEGQVLVKNSHGALPLNKPRALNLFGYDAIGGLNSSSAQGSAVLGAAGLANTQAYTNGRPWGTLDFAASFAEILPNPHAGPLVALNGTLLTGGGSGAITPSSSVSPLDAFQRQARVDNTTLYTDFTSATLVVQDPRAPCIVFINAQSSESWDRSALSDEYSDNLVQSVAAQCANTIVSIHNAGPRIVDAWIDHPNVTAVLFAHTPGQESGNALVKVIYGKQSPSGRLPYTLAKSEADYGVLLNPSLPDKQNPFFPQSDFSEGLNIDYRHFIAANISPRFAFGYGLTYSNFTYSALSISKNSAANTAAYPPDASTSKIPPQGGWSSLYDVLCTVSIQVTNSGQVAAAEVAQLYVGIPGSGQPRVLRGFEKKLVQPGDEAAFSFPLRRRDLSIWDTEAQLWRLPSGEFALSAGKSVLDVQLEGTLQL